MGAFQSSRTTTEPSPAYENSIGGPPQLRKVESFEEKFYRKFTSEPLVPIGCVVTAYFLASGINSFYKRDAIRSQRMMRARVGAQFATLMIFIGYMGMNNADFTLAPMYQRAQEAKKKQLEEEQEGAQS